MKKNILILLVTIVLLCNIGAKSISTNNVLFTTNPAVTFGATFSVTAVNSSEFDGINPYGPSETGLFNLVHNVNNNSLVLSFQGQSLGFGSSWYLVNYGEVLSPSYPYTQLSYGDNKNIIFSYPSTQFFIGFVAQTGYGTPDNFGWINLEYDSDLSSVSMISNATSFGGGIIVGTQTVPEPSTYALFGLGALALVVAYRRKVA